MKKKKNTWDGMTNDEILASYLLDYINIRSRANESDGLANFEKLALDILNNKKYSDINYKNKNIDNKTFWNLAINNTRDKGILKTLLLNGADITIENDLGRSGFLVDRYQRDGFDISKFIIDNFKFIHNSWKTMTDEEKDLLKSLNKNTLIFLMTDDIVKTPSILSKNILDVYDLHSQLDKLEQLKIDTSELTIKYLYRIYIPLLENTNSILNDFNDLKLSYSGAIKYLWNCVDKTKIFVEVMGLSDPSRIKNIYFTNKEENLNDLILDDLKISGLDKNKKHIRQCMADCFSNTDNIRFLSDENRFYCYDNLKRLVDIGLKNELFTKDQILDCITNQDTKSVILSSVLSFQLDDEVKSEKIRAKI